MQKLCPPLCLYLPLSPRKWVKFIEGVRPPIIWCKPLSPVLELLLYDASYKFTQNQQTHVFPKALNRTEIHTNQIYSFFLLSTNHSSPLVPEAPSLDYVQLFYAFSMYPVSSIQCTNKEYSWWKVKLVRWSKDTMIASLWYCPGPITLARIPPIFQCQVWFWQQSVYCRATSLRQDQPALLGWPTDWLEWMSGHLESDDGGHQLLTQCWDRSIINCSTGRVNWWKMGVENIEIVSIFINLWYDLRHLVVQYKTRC